MKDELHMYRQIHAALQSAQTFLSQDKTLLQARIDYEQSLGHTTGLNSRMLQNNKKD